MTSISEITDLRPSEVEGTRATPDPAAGWHQQFGLMHAAVASGFLVTLSGCWLLFGGPAISGAGAVLIGGALIGVPHGSSDFLVAHRLLAPTLGRLWLPGFVLIYMALVLAVIAAWFVAPFTTLLAFLLISGLHFGKEDLEAFTIPHTPLRRMARVCTPLVPVVTLHLSEVAPLFATMSGRDVGAITGVLEPVRLPLLAAWLVATAATVMADFDTSAFPQEGRAVEAGELVALTVAATILPPLVTFAAYFCVVHAVRHMAGLTGGVHPHDGRQALQLAALIIVPSASVCLAALLASWSVLAGVMPTQVLLCSAFQLIAALTVPHMVLQRLDKQAENVR